LGQECKIMLFVLFWHLKSFEFAKKEEGGRTSTGPKKIKKISTEKGQPHKWWRGYNAHRGAGFTEHISFGSPLG